MFEVYSKYPFPVSFRTKFFNIFRYPFINPALEKFLVRKLSPDYLRWWNKFIPPLYFYNPGSVRLVERNSINYKLDISKLLGHSIYFYSVKDQAWDNLFKMLHPDFHVIDAGANIGFLSLNFARACPKGFVYSFEPDSENFYYLQENVNQNDFQNIKLFKTALGAKSGSGELYKMYLNNPGANRILTKSPNSQLKSETVEIATLNRFFEQKVFNKVDLIKIDVEGFELFVLQGATQIISLWKPILFVELADINLRQQNCTALEVLQFIEGLDYYFLDARTMQPLDATVKEHYTDIICFPRNQHPRIIKNYEIGL